MPEKQKVIGKIYRGVAVNDYKLYIPDILISGRRVPLCFDFPGGEMKPYLVKIDDRVAEELEREGILFDVSDIQFEYLKHVRDVEIPDFLLEYIEKYPEIRRYLRDVSIKFSQFTEPERKTIQNIFKPVIDRLK